MEVHAHARGRLQTEQILHQNTSTATNSEQRFHLSRAQLISHISHFWKHEETKSMVFDAHLGSVTNWQAQRQQSWGQFLTCAEGEETNETVDKPASRRNHLLRFKWNHWKSGNRFYFQIGHCMWQQQQQTACQKSAYCLFHPCNVFAQTKAHLPLPTTFDIWLWNYWQRRAVAVPDLRKVYL